MSNDVQPTPRTDDLKTRWLKHEFDTKISPMRTLLLELFELLDKVEESDSGNEFHPNFISSCRIWDGQRINEILQELKAIVTASY